MRGLINRCACAILCLLLVSFCISGCSRRADPEEVILSMLECERALGEGRIYSLAAGKESDGYLSGEMLLSLYGFDRELSGLVDGAICLSPFYYPFELAVFVCESTLCAEDIALAFNNRLALLEKNAVFAAPFCQMSPEEYRAYIKDAEVIISGRYVVLIIASDTAAVKRAFLQAT